MKQVVNFLWIGKELGNIELLSLDSFMLKGYECHLWSWEDILNIPTGVISKDAHEIMPPKENINKAKYSDLFRYKLLYKYGGIWSDLDNICINQIPDSEYIFAPYMGFINNNFIKTPKGCELLLNIINGIEDGSIPFDSSEYTLQYLVEEINKLDLMEFAVNEDDINPIKHNAGITLALDIQDWNTFTGFIVHLFSSSHRVAVKASPIFHQNLDNLKLFINE